MNYGMIQELLQQLFNSARKECDEQELYYPTVTALLEYLNPVILHLFGFCFITLYSIQKALL